MLHRQLRAAREEAGLTQAQVAERVPQTELWVGRSETGQRRVDVVELRALCRGMDICFLGFLQQWNATLEDIARAETPVTEPQAQPAVAQAQPPESPPSLAGSRRGRALTRGENRALRQFLNVFCDKWAAAIVEILSDGTQRFSELERLLPGISKKVLTGTLRDLERAGLVKRRVFAAVPPRVEYSLTPLGHAFIEPLEMLLRWTATHQDDLAAVCHNQKRRCKATA